MVKEGYHHPTAFEIETILAMQQGVDWNVDVMLVECGLGGRMDATNFIPIRALYDYFDQQRSYGGFRRNGHGDC